MQAAQLGEVGLGRPGPPREPAMAHLDQWSPTDPEPGPARERVHRRFVVLAGGRASSTPTE